MSLTHTPLTIHFLTIICIFLPGGSIYLQASDKTIRHLYSKLEKSVYRLKEV